MNIMISTFDTYGDVQLFLALGQELRAAGHTVAICTSASYRPAIAALGLQHAWMSDTLLNLPRALLDGSHNPLAVIRRMRPALRAMLAEEWRATQAFDPRRIATERPSRSPGSSVCQADSESASVLSKVF
jgi:sterol 3beta-glucosyltransferase